MFKFGQNLKPSDKMENLKKAYSEIFKTLNKHKELISFDISDLKMKADIHLFALSLIEEHGLNLDKRSVNSLDWFNPSEFISIGRWGEKYNRTISWSVDGRQPKDEVLVKISFPTGAYIFGGDYPTDFFENFWTELKSYNPDYVDDVNKGLYWNVQNAKEIFNSFGEIYNKYRKLNAEDFKQRRILEMEKELEKLRDS